MIKDFLLCSIPRMTLYYPPTAPAVLKSVLKKAGFECKTIDLVLDWYKTFKKEKNWEEIDNWNLVSKTDNDELDRLVDNKINEWADLILEQKANWIGLSVFSYESHKIGKALAQKIKIKNLTYYYSILYFRLLLNGEPIFLLLLEYLLYF
jgi:hypothetical protein